MTARFSWNQQNTRGHRPRLQAIPTFCNSLELGGDAPAKRCVGRSLSPVGRNIKNCSKTHSHLVDARETLLINRYCSSLNRPPRLRFAKAPRLTQAGNSQSTLYLNANRYVVIASPAERITRNAASSKQLPEIFRGETGGLFLIFDFSRHWKPNCGFRHCKMKHTWSRDEQTCSHLWNRRQSSQGIV